MIPYTFSDTDPQPYKSKNIIPLGKVDITQTPYTVKSLGLNLSRYVITGSGEPDFSGESNLTLVDSGTSPLVGFFYGNGAPPGFSAVTRFAYKYTGYFYARRSGVIEMTAIGNGKLKVQISDMNVIGGGGYQELSPLSYIQTGAYRPGSSWFSISIYYYSTTIKSGFALMWKDNSFWGDTSDENNVGLPVSAGLTSTTNSFLSTDTVLDVESISFTQGRDESSTMKFTVPLGSEGGTGYYYDNTTDTYINNTNNLIKLKRGWLVEGHAGFKDSAGTKEYVKKFTGNIYKIVPKRDAKGNDSISVTCMGFENFLNTAINLNYPDLWDYWVSGYAGKGYSATNPEGVNISPTFDLWEMTTAVRSLMIRAYIDPTLFLGRKQFLNNSGSAVNGSFLMQKSAPTPIYLDKSRNYGQPYASFGDDSIDTSYVLKSNFGDKITDYINKVVDPYGWEWGFVDYYNGAPFLRQTNNPTSIVDTDEGSYSGFGGTSYDLNAIKGEYKIGSSSGNYVQFSFKGKKVDIIVPQSTSNGTHTTVSTGSTSTVVNIASGQGSNFSSSERVVVQMGAEDESSIIQSISSDAITVSPAFSRPPSSGSYFKHATFSAEVTRGGSPVSTTYGSSAWDSSGYSSFNRVGTTGAQDVTLDSVRHYYQGMDPRSNRNPCKFRIAGDLTFDDHMVKITRLAGAGGSGDLYIDSLFVYDENNEKPVFTFRSGDASISGTLTNIDLVDTGKDQRNDTIVVGRRLGPEAAGFQQKVINPNNPSFRHINSRAMDMASIMDSSVRNFVGRPLQTIQIDPDLSSTARADHWAATFINRYRVPERAPTFSCIMNPLLEINDCIALSDEGRGIINSYDKVWIESIQTKITATKAIDTIKTTSFEPWASFSPRPQVNSLDNFGGLAISNLTVLQSSTGQAASAEDPFDPYTYHETGNRIQITYDLNVDADVRIDIVQQDGVKVDTLLNPAASDGSQGWDRQTMGKNYVVEWFGIDRYGDWNKNIPVEEGQDKIGAGFFVGERGNSATYTERFYVRILIDEVQGNKIHTVTSHNDFGDQYIHTRRGEKIEIFASTSPTYYGNSPNWINQTTPPGSVVGANNTGSRGGGAGRQIGFFSNDNLYGEQDAGLKISFITTNTYGTGDWRPRPSQVFINIDMICLGMSTITVTTIDGGDTKTILYPFATKTSIQPGKVETFQDRRSTADGWYHFYFDPARWGYLFTQIDPTYLPGDLVTDETGILEALRNAMGEPLPLSDSYTVSQVPYAVAWYLKITVDVVDFSGRKATSEPIYHRWDGLYKGALTNTVAVPGDNDYLRYKPIWDTFMNKRSDGEFPSATGAQGTLLGTIFRSLVFQGNVSATVDQNGWGNVTDFPGGYGMVYNIL